MKYLSHRLAAPLMIVGLASLSILPLSAAPVSLQEAQNVARNWMQLKTGVPYHVKKPRTLAATATQGTPPAYRLIELEPHGWVIVASDDVAKPIIGYGRSPVDAASLPPAFSAWMGQVDRAIKSAIKKNTEKTELGAAPSPASEWARLKQDPAAFASRNHSQKLGDSPYVVAPLLWLGGSSETSGILWNQDTYYNDLTPFDTNGENNHALTGCVATAMGQIMRYYQAPAHGTGSYAYSDTTANGYQHDYGTLSANFGATTYDWANMPTQLTDASTPAQVAAVSTLLYHAGVSVGMDYGTGVGDGGSLSAYHDPTGGAAADTALRNYFGFTQAEWQQQSTYTINAWVALLKDSLDNQNPILYAGTGTGGHAFVLDGYAADDTFHFNWGWGGQFNGQYALTNLNPGPYSFTNQQQAIFLSGATRTDTDTTTTTGGGCTYNPHNQGIDLLMVLMALLALMYPFGRRYFR